MPLTFALQTFLQEREEAIRAEEARQAKLVSVRLFFPDGRCDMAKRLGRFTGH